jgi:hypothetical protein
MADAQAVGDQAPVKTSFVDDGGHPHEQDHDPPLRASVKRDRDGEFVDGSDPTILLHPDEDVQDDESDGSKKAKLEGIGLDDDSLLDDLKHTQLGLLYYQACLSSYFSFSLFRSSVFSFSIFLDVTSFIAVLFFLIESMFFHT